MKKLLLCLLFIVSIPALGQVSYYGNEGQLATVKVSVTDAKGIEPLPYASVYLTGKRDTIISHFTLTDTLGAAMIREVPFGVYKFHIEIMGFKPYVKDFNFRRNVEDLGVVKLRVDEKFIKEAIITGIGNPIVIKKDTIEYNAAAFIPGANAMLRDLLLRMPGIEITETGKVRAGGEMVSHITVNGKTFFFDDQSMALNNLPASIIDKIRVIDKKSEQERITGIADGQRTKVVDVALKKEYEDGWFGNAEARGGTTLDFSDNELRDDRGFLYGGKALVSAYNATDQITFIGNATNISDSGAIGQPDRYVVNGANDGGNSGLTASAQLGINGVTTRVKDIELAASSSYNYSSSKSASKTLRTTFLESGDMLSESVSTGLNLDNTIKANASAKKETGKFTFNFSTTFFRSESHSDNESGTETSRENTLLNNSVRSAHGDMLSRSIFVATNAGYSGIGGNRKRVVSANATLYHYNTGGNSLDYSKTAVDGRDEIIDLSYDRASKTNSLDAGLSYSEPLGDKFSLNARASFSGRLVYSDNEAFNADGSANDYYSTLSDNRFLSQGYGASLGYANKGLQLSVGASAEGMQNRLLSRSKGLEALTGEDWVWSVIPNGRISYYKNTTSISLSARGRQDAPPGFNMRPTLDVSSPTMISAGNIYLRPGSSVFSDFSFYRGFPEKFAALTAVVMFSMKFRPVISASWYDTNGIRYSVPVNAQRAQGTLRAYIHYNTPINKEKTLTLDLDLSGDYNNYVSYRAVRPIEPLVAERTDYSAFMSRFWGDDASGERFYSGASGFEENNTDAYLLKERINVRYNKGVWGMTVGYTNTFNYTHYSLPGSSNVITTRNRVGLTGRYTTPHRFELNTELNYNFFTGYSDGYGRPEWHWDQSVSKDIGAFTLTLAAYDILGQARNLSHIDYADYMMDSYRLMMGRYVMFGIKWNFGKMNTAQDQRAQQARSRANRYSL